MNLTWGPYAFEQKQIQDRKLNNKKIKQLKNKKRSTWELNSIFWFLLKMCLLLESFDIKIRSFLL